ncbi:MAG: MFS transporter, partial [Chloroflexota bacterium]
ASPVRLRRPPKVFYGWWIVAISLVDDSLKHGTFNRGFTLYVPSIRHELGIGVAVISLADMLGRLEGGILGPVAGYLTDRLGPATMLAIGGLLSGIGFILLSLTHSYWYFMLIFIGFLSLGFRSGYNNASIAALNNWFRRKRSLAMSIASIGNGLGGALAPLVGLMVFTLGWRPAALISGIAIIAVVIPLSFLVRRSPESMGLLPDGASPESSQVQLRESPSAAAAGNPGTAHPALARPRANPSAADPDFTVKEAMRTPSYWLLVLAVGLRNTVHSGMSFLLAPVMVWFLASGGRGEKESLPIAALFVGLLSFSTLFFNPCVGWLGDTWSKQRLSAVAMVAGGLALVVLLWGHTSGHLWVLAIFAILLALSESANPLAWAIMGDFFGRRSFATLRGWQHLPDQLMSMSTPVWMGWIFDRTSSYFWALVPLIVVYGLSAFFYWILPKPNIPSRVLRPE